jgi:hypothetical protein
VKSRHGRATVTVSATQRTRKSDPPPSRIPLWDA